MQTTRDWRERAMDVAMSAEGFYGGGIEILVREIRRHAESHATLTVWPDRLQLLTFLEREAAGYRSLLTANHSHIERDQRCPYVAWYALEWRQSEIEIALEPNFGISGAAVLIGSDSAVLERFAVALETYAVRPAGRVLRYATSWESAPEIDAELGRITWDDLVLPHKLLTDIRESIEGFFQHKEAFTRLGFPWRRGLLLIGPPGTGKTMVCKAAAAAVPELPFLYVRDLKEDGRGRNPQDAVLKIFERARKLAPCLLAFEDIDGLITEERRTFFLNEIDGFENNDGLLIIASSNHPGKIDEALLKRPSRFDRVFHLGLPSRAERYEYSRRLLARSELASHLTTEVEIESLAQRVAERTEGFTPAYLKEVFLGAALERAQAGSCLLDAEFRQAVLQQVEELRRYLRALRDPEALAEIDGQRESMIGFRRLQRQS